MEHNQLQKPEYWQSALELYLKLKEITQLWTEIDQKGSFIRNGETLLSESVTHSFIILKWEINE